MCSCSRKLWAENTTVTQVLFCTSSCWVLLKVSLKLGRLAVSNKFSSFSSKFWLCSLHRESVFYLHNISKGEHNTEIVLHVYFPHAVGVVWITSRVEGTVQHPRGIWDWATAKIRCCRKKWKRVYLQWSLQNCTWAARVSSAAAEKLFSRWLQVILCMTQIKPNICFCFSFTFTLHLGFPVRSTVSDHPLQAGLVTTWRFLLCSLLSVQLRSDLGGVTTVKMEVPSWTGGIPLVTLLLLFIPLRTLEGK